jgi:hypothetical protein
MIQVGTAGRQLNFLLLESGAGEAGIRWQMDEGKPG